MTIEINRGHNERSAEYLNLGARISEFCPTAVAFCEQTDYSLGSIAVSFKTIYNAKAFNSLWMLPPELESAIRAYTSRGEPILGKFTIYPV